MGGAGYDLQIKHTKNSTDTLRQPNADTSQGALWLYQLMAASGFHRESPSPLQLVFIFPLFLPG